MVFFARGQQKNTFGIHGRLLLLLQRKQGKKISRLRLLWFPAQKAR